jgi:transposase
LIQITPQIRILVAVEPIDAKKGINLAQFCRDKLAADPFSRCFLSFAAAAAPPSNCLPLTNVKLSEMWS